MGCGSSKVVQDPVSARGRDPSEHDTVTTATEAAVVHSFESSLPPGNDKDAREPSEDDSSEIKPKLSSQTSIGPSCDVEVLDLDESTHNSNEASHISNQGDADAGVAPSAYRCGQAKPNHSPKYTTVAVPSSISSAVSLKYLLGEVVPRTEELAQDLGVTEVSASTFWDWVIRPGSEDAGPSKRSYVSAADLSGTPLVPRSALLPATARKPHTVYVIYYHTMPLPTLIGALQQYFQHHTRIGTDTYVWLDILSVDLTKPLDVTHVTSAIAAASKVALIIDDNADVFGRAWCLFELWWAHHVHGHRGPPSAWLHVLPTGYQNDSMALVEALFAASFADAKCSVRSDYAALLACMRGAPGGGPRGFRGPSHVAMTVVDAVWAALLQHMQRAPHSARGEASMDTVRVLSVRVMHAYACRKRKRYREAERHLNAALAEARRMAPPLAGAVTAAAPAGPPAKHPRMQPAAGTREASPAASPPGSPCLSVPPASDHASSALLGLLRPPAGVAADAASTVASLQFASITEEVQQLVFRATLDLAQCCLEQGRLQEATEHARRATQFAYQGHTSATGSAAASVLLGEVYRSMGNHGAALSAFTTAMTVLTQHGLRTQQGGAVMRHIGRCFLEQEEFRKARSHLSEALKILSDILPADHPELDAVREDVATLCAQQHRHEGVVATLGPVRTRRRPAFPDPAATLRRLTMLAAALSELQHWRAAASAAARAATEAARLWDCIRSLAEEPRHLQPSAKERARARDEVRAHLVSLATLACHCLHSASASGGGGGEALPVIARLALEAAAWSGFREGRVAAGLLHVAAAQQSAGCLREAMYIYYSCHHHWDDWRQLSQELAHLPAQTADGAGDSQVDVGCQGEAGESPWQPPAPVRSAGASGSGAPGGHADSSGPVPPSWSPPTGSSLRSSYDLSEADCVAAADEQLQADLQLFWDRSGSGGDAPAATWPQLPPPSRLECLRSLAGTLYARGEVTAELGVLWQIVEMAEECMQSGRRSHSGRRALRDAEEATAGGSARRVDAEGYVVDTFDRDSANARTLVVVRRRIGSCLVSLGRQDQAVEELRACAAAAQSLLSGAAADADVLAAQVMLGTVLRRVGDHGRAQRQLAQHLPALMARPAHANSALAREGMLALGQCLARVKRHEEAVRTLQEAAAMFKAAGLPDGRSCALQLAMRSQEALVDTARRPRGLSFAVGPLRLSTSASRSFSSRAHSVAHSVSAESL
eukprot:jgi/Ulvmu1/1870/UM012_0026.1